MAVRKGRLRRLLGRSNPHSRFARLLVKPGFDPDLVRAEVTGQVVYGPPGADPECRGYGAVALLPGREIGWVAPRVADPEWAAQEAVALPDRLDGTVEPSRIVGWSLSDGDLTIEHLPRLASWPLRRDGGPRLLRLTSDPAQLAGFVAQASRALPGSKRR